MSHLSDLRKCKTRSQLSNLLGYKLSVVTYIVYGQPDESKYSSFEIKKSSGGTRTISAPEPKLKELQRRLSKLLMFCLTEIDEREGVAPVSQAFRPGRTIKTNASKHKRKTHVLNFDLKDFFSNINFGRIQGYLIKNKHFSMRPKVATLIAHICVHEGILPQGAPTSPVISNLIARPLDRKLLLLSKRSDCIYSRYADDITISTSKSATPNKIFDYSETMELKLSKALTDIVEKSGFSINHSKTRLSKKFSRQEVTGLIVNRRVNIKSEYYRTTRSQVSNLLKKGFFYDQKEKKKELDLEVLEGKLAHIYNIKWPYDKKSLGSTDSSNKIMKDFMTARGIKDNIPNYLEIYRDFLAYKLISAEKKPILLTEGKTDITHIKSAIKRRKNKFGDLFSDDAFSIQFIKQSSRTSLFLGLSNGVSSYAQFIADFREYFEYMPSLSPNNPVIILVDNDSAVNTIRKSCRKYNVDIDIDKEEDFYQIWSNLYVIKTNGTEGGQSTCIEDLHRSETLNKEIEGKKFNKEKAHKDNRYVGKEVFANYVSRNKDSIDFSGFDVVLTRISKVIDNFSSSRKSNKAAAN